VYSIAIMYLSHGAIMLFQNPFIIELCSVYTFIGRKEKEGKPGWKSGFATAGGHGKCEGA